MVMLQCLALLVSLVLIAGCASVNSVLFVTKTSLGIDLDSKPPSASIAYDRIEGYLGPRYDNGAVPPVVARIQTDGKIFNPRVRQLYATGDAATLVVKPTGPTRPSDLSGEKRLMFFGTTTTIGLKVSFTGEVPDSFHLGYKRKEFSFIPLGRTKTSDGKEVDVYPSVLATLDNRAQVGAGPSATGLEVGQLFATGTTAEELAKDPAVQGLFRSEVIGAFSVYRAAVTEQEAEATRILRCYLGVWPGGLSEVWTHAQGLGLFRETGILAEMNKWHQAATASEATAAVREGNLRKVNQQYASEIAIVDGSTPTRLGKLIEHRVKVCEIASR